MKTVGDAMTHEVSIADGAASLADALRLMHGRLDHVVVTEASNPVGMLTDRDAVRLAAAGASCKRPCAK